MLRLHGRLAASLLLSLMGITRGDEPPPSPLTPVVKQLVLVVVPDWQSTSGTLQRFSRGPTAWVPDGPSFRVSVGRAGTGWGLGRHSELMAGPVKREGDGRSPAGVFDIGPAFGKQPQLATGLDYLALDGGHWCIDVSESPHYNRIVHQREVGEAAVVGSTEPMRRDLQPAGDDQYRIGFVIGHNPTAQPGAGSCIFAHPWLDEGTSTAGCIGASEDDLLQTLAWLDAAAAPRLVLLPAAEHRRLVEAWGLPRELEPPP
jgi:L,D-peptidoglycan transpeptidase YkuD (ErfK/YbiS/YcfS/YnhG family)